MERRAGRGAAALTFLLGAVFGALAAALFGRRPQPERAAAAVPAAAPPSAAEDAALPRLRFALARCGTDLTGQFYYLTAPAGAAWRVLPGEHWERCENGVWLPLAGAPAEGAGERIVTAERPLLGGGSFVLRNARRLPAGPCRLTLRVAPADGGAEREVTARFEAEPSAD